MAIEYNPDEWTAENRTPSDSTTKWQAAFTSSLEKYPSDTVFHETARTAQNESYSCGPAVLTSVANTFVSAKEQLTEEQSIGLARRLIEKQGGDIEEWGTPPDIMEAVLTELNIPFEVRPSDTNFTEQKTLEAAATWLDNQLLTGHVCITPIQTTPEYWVVNEETEEIMRAPDLEESEDGKIPAHHVVRTTRELWLDPSQPPQNVSEGNIAASTKEEVDYNGHYVLVVGRMHSPQGKAFYITVDPTYHWMQEEAIERGEGIEPRYAGVRFIEASYFIKNWHDVSGTGEPFNQYAISIPVSN